MPSASGSPWLSEFVAKYRRDHSHPVNHVLHVGVGWPMVAAALLLLPFRPLWSLGLFLGGYAFMFSGHFLFERNLPTILSRPSTPFVIAWAVVRDLARGLGRLASPRRGNEQGRGPGSLPRHDPIRSDSIRFDPERAAQ
ncbi:DUF962 domain-containing protein [Tautonia sociabilis]|uniref:DUF962 domain-containing protein n=2 Tax=Tautonia sociabilis TaxID=2080755 RepID=A0A432MK09_9BACT|nr:DUF962 domain-containing protein [Tautonia sociabilis]